MQEENEWKVTQHLADGTVRPSVSSGICVQWGLTREKVRKVYKRLPHERSRQTTLSNLIGATRFEAMVGTQLWHTLCPRCGQVDSWSHFCECYTTGLDEEVVEEEWLNRVDKLTGTLQKEQIDKPKALR